MRDIDYFSESKMNAVNHINFKHRLPSNLKIFLAKYSVHPQVLQGYRGPPALVDGSCGDSEVIYPSNGMQEIRYWYGTSKSMNLIPVLGWIAFGMARASDDCDWYSIFFDESTGEALSTDKNEAEKIKNKRTGNEEKEYFLKSIVLIFFNRF